PARVHTHGVAGAILKLDRVYRWRHVFATFFPAPARVSGAQTARSPARPTRAADAPARRNRAGRHAGPWAIDAGGGVPARRAAARRAPGPPAAGSPPGARVTRSTVPAATLRAAGPARRVPCP